MLLLVTAASTFILLSLLGCEPAGKAPPAREKSASAEVTPDLHTVEGFDWSMPVQFTVAREDGTPVLDAALGHAYTPRLTIRPGTYVFALYGEGCPTPVTLHARDRVTAIVTLRGDECEMTLRRND